MIPSEKKRITICLDEDAVAYFKKGGSRYRTRTNVVLKPYAITKKKKHQQTHQRRKRA